MSEIRVGVVDQGAASVAGAAARGGGAPWGGNSGAEAGGRKRGVGGKNALTALPPPVDWTCCTRLHLVKFDLEAPVERYASTSFIPGCNFRTLRTHTVTVMHTSSTVPIATPAMMPAKVLSARSAS